MNSYLKISSITLILAVAIGAFGAHALNDILIENQRLDTFATGSDYHFFHGLGMLMISILSLKKHSKYLKYAFFSHLTGIFFFSGSLYILSITNIGWFGAITPIGGILFIIGWICVVLYVSHEQKNR